MCCIVSGGVGGPCGPAVVEQSTSPRTSSGASNAAANATEPPSELPTSTAGPASRARIRFAQSEPELLDGVALRGLVGLADAALIVGDDAPVVGQRFGHGHPLVHVHEAAGDQQHERPIAA